MSSLAQLQGAFLDAVVDESLAAQAPRIRAGRLSPAQRLAIYRHNVFSSWRGALAEDYPVVARLVGPAFFAEAAKRYALAHPSTSGDLGAFGAAFADFLATYPHARDLAYLRDVARLEWAWHGAFHAPAAPPFDLQALAEVPAESYAALRFRLHPAVHLVQSEHPILAIWEANQPEHDGTPQRIDGAEAVLVHRPELDVRVVRLERADWSFLHAVALGETLETATERAGYGEGPMLGAALRRFVAARVIAGFTTAP